MATLSASCPGGARAAARVAAPRRRVARVVATPSSASTAGRFRFRRRDDGEHDAPAGDARRTAPRPSRGGVVVGGASSPHRATRRRRARVATRATAPGDSGGVDDAATAATAASSTTENQNQNPSSPPSHVGADRRRTKSQSPSLRFFPPDVARAVQQCGVGVTVAFGGLVFAVSFATLVFRRVLFCCLHRSPYDRVGAVNADP